MEHFYHYPFPPQNYLAEEILLGTILIHPYIFPQITNVIKAESFFLERHQVIYKHLKKIYTQNKLDSVQLLYTLSDTKNLNNIGGIGKIMNLMKQSQSYIMGTNISTHTKELADGINNDYIKRLMIQYGYNIVRLAYIKKFPSHQLYNRASNYLNATVKKIPKQNLDNFKDLIGDLLFNLKYKYKNPQKIEKTNINKHIILSGFQFLDKLTNGLPNGDLIVIAGRPSMGKTSFAINIVNNIINNLNIGICIFTLEMSKIQILEKLVSIASTIPTKNITFSAINKNDWYSIQQICNKLLLSGMYINDTPDMSIDYIEYTSKLLKKETIYVDMIIIDYLQLIQVEGLYHDSRAQELSYITRKLKLLAQNLEIPIIILSQLNRSIESRASKIPMLSDLRESGCLEYQNKIHVDRENKIHIKNITSIEHYKQPVKLISQYILKKSKYCIPNNLTKKNQILLKYIYRIKIYKTININLTNNHQLYTKLSWLQQSCLIDSLKLLKYTFLEISHNIMEKTYVQKIDSVTYSQVYDLSIPEYLTFICDQMILHNSIEQDADIVMMLYKKDNNENEENTSKLKTLDIFLCKNRNGPTGFCKLLFSLENTTFTSLSDSSLDNLGLEHNNNV